MLVGEAYLSRLDRPRDAAACSAPRRRPCGPARPPLARGRGVSSTRAGVGEEQGQPTRSARCPSTRRAPGGGGAGEAGAAARRARAALVARGALGVCARVDGARVAREEVLRVAAAGAVGAPRCSRSAAARSGEASDDERRSAFLRRLARAWRRVYLVASAWSVAMKGTHGRRPARRRCALAAALAVSFAMDALDVMMLEGISL